MAGLGAFGNLGQLIATLGLNTQPFMKGMEQANKSMVQFATGAQVVGRAMTRFVTLPMILAGGAAVNTQKNFEASMTKITSLVGVSREAVNAWKKDVLKMSKITGRGPEELANALYFVTSAGIRGADAMQVLEMSAKASAVGLGETKVIADLVTSAMNAYGKENLSAAQATDILIAAVREGKAEADELAGAMGMVLPIASEYGVTFDQVGAAFASMTRTGTNARVAATQLKNILASMAAPSLQTEEALAAVNMSASDFRKTIREEGLIKALLDLREATKGDEEALAKIFPNIRGLMGVLDMLGKNVEYNKQIFESLKNSAGSLERAFAEVGGTVQQKLNVAMATFKATLVSVGEALKPFISKTLARLSDSLDRISERWTSMTEAQRKFKLTLMGITAALGPLAVITSRVIMILSTSLGPIVAIAAALAVLTGLVVRYITRTKTANSIMRKSKETMDQVNASAEKEAIIIGHLFDALKNAEKGTKEWEDAKNRLNGIYGPYLENLITEKDTIEDLAEAYKRIVTLRQAEIKMEGATEEIGRVTKEAEAAIEQNMGRFRKIVARNAEELYKDGKLPQEYATAMDEIIRRGAKMMKAGDSAVEVMESLRSELIDVYQDYIGKFQNDWRDQWMYLNWFDAIRRSIITQQGGLEQIDFLTGLKKSAEKDISDFQKTIDERVKDLDLNISLWEDSAGAMTKIDYLQGLINLKTEKQSILLDQIAKDALGEEIKGLQTQLDLEKRRTKLLGAEEAIKGKISRLEEQRKKLGKSELEANSQATREAERALAILQNETSGLNQIEKLRKRITIEKDAALEKSGEELRIANESIQTSEQLLELMEARAADYNTLTQKQIELNQLKENQKKLEGDAAKDNARSIGILEEEITLENMQQKLMENQVSQLGDVAKLENDIAIKKAVLGQYDDEQRKAAVKQIVLDEQRLAEMKAYVESLGEIGQKEIEIAQLKDDQTRMTVEQAAEQQKIIDQKEDELATDKERVAGYNELTNLTNKISRDEEKLQKLSGEELKAAQERLIADRMRKLVLEAETGILTEHEKRQKKILELELERLKAILEEKGKDTSDVDARLKKLRQEDDILTRIEGRRTGEIAPRDNSLDQIKQIFAAFQTLRELKGESTITAGEWFQEWNDKLGELGSVFNHYFQAIGNVVQTFIQGQADQLEAAKQRELSAAGNSAVKRKAIEKKYFKEQQKLAVRQAIINTALAVGNALGTVQPFIPAALIAAGVAAAAGAIQIGIIKSQKFAKGGIVSARTLAEVAEYPNAKSNPEVIAPLSELKKFFPDKSAGGPPKEIILRVRGRDAYAIIKTQELLNNTY